MDKAWGLWTSTYQFNPAPRGATIQYQPHIDGLRAVAIVPVVLFHAGVTSLSGGFVGVDIFFVISGYLITAIISADLAQGQFSFADFYRRRMLRILPLLAVVLLAVLTAGQVVLFPAELQALGASAVATALFVSNILFYLTTDYFEASARSIPLLHTWSLAVEEQFYLVFPVLAWALHRWARRYLVIALLALVLSSLVLSVFGTQLARFFTFYLLPTRVWELGAGALLALAPARPIGSRPLRELIAWLGLALLIAPMFYLSEASAFPGINALPPVLGAVFLIGYAQGTSIGAALSSPPLVYLGLISYALYLWHWPVIVFDLAITGPDQDSFDIARVLALSLGLAALSRPLIELPFRRGLQQVPSPRLLLGGVAALLVLAGAGLTLMRGDLGARSFPGEVLALANYARYPDTAEYRAHFQAGHCFLDQSNLPGTVLDRAACLRLDPARPNILLLGDSHAAHLSGGLRAAYPQYNFLQATAAGCRPLPGIWQDARCVELSQFVIETFLPKAKLDGVIVAGRWRTGDVAGIAALADNLHQHVPAVMIVGPSVEYAAGVPGMLARAQVWGGAPGLLSHAMLPGPAEVDRVLAAALTLPGITYRSPLAIVCPDRNCRETAPDGAPMQFDYGHLTLAGAKVVASGLLDGWLDN
jgi:peptidoglycan/LPS O-acetylase OafA/YrhL